MAYSKSPPVVMKAREYLIEDFQGWLPRESHDRIAALVDHLILCDWIDDNLYDLAEGRT